MSDTDDERRPNPDDAANDQPTEHDTTHTGATAADIPAAEPTDGAVADDTPVDAPAVDAPADAPADEPPVEPGSVESVPADAPAPAEPASDAPVPAGEPAPAGDAPTADALDGADASAASSAAGDDPEFGSAEQLAGDQALDAPGTPPRATVHIDDPDADDVGANPMADAPVVRETPAAAAVPPLVEPKPPVEPARTTPIGAYPTLDDASQGDTADHSEHTPPVVYPPAERSTEDDHPTARYPAAAPLPPVGPAEPAAAEAGAAAGTGAGAAGATSVFGASAFDRHDAVEPSVTRDEVFQRQKDAFAGIKLGSGFFGAVVTTGIFVILLGIVSGVAAAFGLTSRQDVTDGDGTFTTASIVASIVLAVVLFVAALCGGYVAGRMARFAGVKQGLGSWLWGIVFLILAGLAAWYTGANRSWDSAVGGSSMHGLQLAGGQWWTGMVAIVVVLAVTLLGAIAGGALGMRYHRRVDRAGFEPPLD